MDDWLIGSNSKLHIKNTKFLRVLGPRLALCGSIKYSPTENTLSTGTDEEEATTQRNVRTSSCGIVVMEEDCSLDNRKHTATVLDLNFGRLNKNAVEFVVAGISMCILSTPRQ